MLPAQVVAVLVVERLEREPAETAVEHAVLSLRLAQLVHQEVDSAEAGVGGWEQRKTTLSRLPITFILVCFQFILPLLYTFMLNTNLAKQTFI